MILHSDDLDFGRIRAEFELPTEFPAVVERQAAEATDAHAGDRQDLTSWPFVTIDPPGSMDLDQAMYLEQVGDQTRVHYAIADVGALVEPGSELEAESLRRGQTCYLPDGTVPLHPRTLSEDAASLLPEQVRPAVVWSVDVDSEGETTAIDVRRALVRSVARLDYAGVQRDADTGDLHPAVAALPLLGGRLRLRGLRAGALNLRLPAQSVERSGEAWRLRIEPRVAADDWNAQISLLVGRAAAQLMIDRGVGMLRTLPPAPDEAIDELRDAAVALHQAWSADEGLGPLLERIDPNTPNGLAFMRQSTAALRGAGYVVLGPDAPPEDRLVHSGIGGPYAHVTAPIRRVADRYVTEVCLAAVAGTEIPGWAVDRIAELPAVMRESDRLTSRVDRACTDLAEAVALEAYEGARREVVVLRAPNGNRPAEVFCQSPPVFGDCEGDVQVGTRVTATVVDADPEARTIRFAAG